MDAPQGCIEYLRTAWRGSGPQWLEATPALLLISISFPIRGPHPTRALFPPRREVYGWRVNVC